MPSGNRRSAIEMIRQERAMRGGPELARRTTSAAMRSTRGPSPGALSAIVIARSPMSTSGSRTVVSAGVTSRAIGMSSKPTTVTSSGTDRPRERSIANAPIAIESFSAMIAVRSGFASSNRAAAGAHVRVELEVERPGERGVVVAGAGEDDRRYLVGAQQLDVLQLAVGVAVAVADHDEPAMCGGDPLEAAGDLREVRVRHVVHDDPNRGAVRASQLLGVGVGHVLQLRDRPQHPRPQLVGHELVTAVDDA